MKITIADKLIAYLALISGLSISAVAVYYSVAGLISIFAAAVIPIMVMGVTLELSKLVATVWLKQNWAIAPKLIRAYLLIAVTILMIITSMGIFGYLSKAHLDQNLVSGDVTSKIAVYDEKIKTEKENIDANRKILKQLDESVDQVMGRSQDEKGAEKAVAIRKAQQKERGRIAQDITESQKKITALNEERAPIAAEVRKVEAEVGPIKYIAALLYGDNPDQNVLEKAVRAVIILIVIIFDPLAVVLLLSSQYSFQWFRKVEEEEEKIPYKSPVVSVVVEESNKQGQAEGDSLTTESGDGIAKEATVTTLDEVNLEWKEKEDVPKDIKYTFLDDVDDGEEPIACYKCGTTLITVPGIGPFCPNKTCDVIDGPFDNEQLELDFDREVETTPVDPGPDFEGIKVNGEWVQTGPKFDNEVSLKEIENELDWALSADATTPIANVENETADQKYVNEIIANINPGAGIDHDSGAGIDHDSVEIHESGHADVKGYIQNGEQQSSSLWSQIADKKTN